MQGLAVFQMAYEHREKLLREAERHRRVQELRAVRRKERLRVRDRVRAALRALGIEPSSLFAGQAR